MWKMSSTQTSGAMGRHDLKLATGVQLLRVTFNAALGRNRRTAGHGPF